MCSSFATSGRRTPTTTRSGLLKSSIAAPSLRNSGLLATSKETFVTSAIRRASSALVPTGTVLLMTIVLGESKMRGDLAADLPHAAQVRAAVVALGRPDGDEDDFRLARFPRRASS